MDFSDVVTEKLTKPLNNLCELFELEAAEQELTYFRGILTMLADPGDEPMVLAATIELSKCAFLGFEYSPIAQMWINQILDDAIELAHTMSAPDVH